MGKRALITGASGGIGLELARIHASFGDDLILVARSLDKLENIKKELENDHGIDVKIISVDLAVRDAARKVFDEVEKCGLHVDYLINNAGFGDFGFFHESSWEKQEMMVSLNITALMQLTWHVLPGMIRMGEGRILNVASTAAFQPGPTMSVYFASKAFVLSFSEAINNELKDKGVSVTALCPGSTDTGFHAVALGDPQLVRERRMDTAARVALTGYRAMMKGKPVVFHGFKNLFMANAVRFFPRSFIVKMARKIQEKKNLSEPL